MAFKYADSINLECIPQNASKIQALTEAVRARYLVQSGTDECWLPMVTGRARAHSVYFESLSIVGLNVCGVPPDPEAYWASAKN